MVLPAVTGSLHGRWGIMNLPLNSVASALNELLLFHPQGVDEKKRRLLHFTLQWQHSYCPHPSFPIYPLPPVKIIHSGSYNWPPEQMECWTVILWGNYPIIMFRNWGILQSTSTSRPLTLLFASSAIIHRVSPNHKALVQLPSPFKESLV